MIPPIFIGKGQDMKCEIFSGQDWNMLQVLITGFLSNKKLIDMKQSVVRRGFLEDYHLLVITIIYEEK